MKTKLQIEQQSGKTIYRNEDDKIIIPRKMDIIKKTKMLVTTLFIFAFILQCIHFFSDMKKYKSKEITVKNNMISEIKTKKQNDFLSETYNIIDSLNPQFVNKYLFTSCICFITNFGTTIPNNKNLFNREYDNESHTSGSDGLAYFAKLSDCYKYEFNILDSNIFIMKTNDIEQQLFVLQSIYNIDEEGIKEINNTIKKYQFKNESK